METPDLEHVALVVVRDESGEVGRSRYKVREGPACVKPSAPSAGSRAGGGHHGIEHAVGDRERSSKGIALDVGGESC